MSILSLALRNILRNKRRSALTIFGIGATLGMMVGGNNLQYDMHQTMLETAISTSAGHVVIQEEGYQDDPAAERVVQDSSALSAELSKALPDAIVLRRAFLDGLLVAPTNTVGVGVSGFEPEVEAQVSTLHEKVVEGSWLDDDPLGIVIGVGLAKKLAVGVGDKLVYMGQATGEMESQLFRVKGIFRTGAAGADSFLAATRLDSVQGLLPGTDPATQITVHLADDKLTDAATATAKGIVSAPGLVTMSWREALPSLGDFIRLDRTGNNFVWGIIALIVGIGVLNTVLMSVLERTREFGVLLAIGMKPRILRRMVVLEGFVTGLLGMIAGLLLGGALTWYLMAYGLDYSAMMGETMDVGGVNVSTIFSARPDWGRMVVYSVGAVVICMVASAYPAWKVTHIRPVEAMRHD